jgi:hypothetical protein
MFNIGIKNCQEELGTVIVKKVIHYWKEALNLHGNLGNQKDFNYVQEFW